MIDHDLVNAIASDDAHWRMEGDGALAWICGPSAICPLAFQPKGAADGGALILRRWTGKKYPRPEFPIGAGFALRPATTVTESTGVTKAADTIYWLAVERVSPGGIGARGPVRRAIARATDGAGNYVGPMPNPPTMVTTRRAVDGNLELTWYYNPEGQQVAPADFAIYSDEGSGTFNAAPQDTVTYASNRRRYTWQKTGTGWAGWLWIVLARSAAGALSLTQLPGGRGLSDIYGVGSATEGDSAKTEVDLTEAKAPPTWGAWR